MKRIVHAVILSIVIISTVGVGIGTAACGDECEQAWDKCAQGDCRDWDRLTNDGRSSRCDHVIADRWR